MKSKLDAFRATRRGTLALVHGLSQRQIDFEPAPDKWSLAQVLDHLTRTDRIFRKELKALVRRGRSRGSAFLVRTLSDFDYRLPLVPRAFTPVFDLPLAAVGVAVPRPVRQAIARSRAVPAKSPKIIRPRKGRAAEDLRRELRDYFDFVEDLVAGNPGVRYRRLYYYNPLTAFTNFPGILSFTASHESRHQEQIRDIRTSPGFPRSSGVQR